MGFSLSLASSRPYEETQRKVKISSKSTRSKTITIYNRHLFNNKIEFNNYFPRNKQRTFDREKIAQNKQGRQVGRQAGRMKERKKDGR